MADAINYSKEMMQYQPFQKFRGELNPKQHRKSDNEYYDMRPYLFRSVARNDNVLESLCSDNPVKCSDSCNGVAENEARKRKCGVDVEKKEADSYFTVNHKRMKSDVLDGSLFFNSEANSEEILSMGSLESPDSFGEREGFSRDSHLSQKKRERDATHTGTNTCITFPVKEAQQLYMRIGTSVQTKGQKAARFDRKSYIPRISTSYVDNPLQNNNSNVTEANAVPDEYRASLEASSPQNSTGNYTETLLHSTASPKVNTDNRKTNFVSLGGSFNDLRRQVTEGVSGSEMWEIRDKSLLRRAGSDSMLDTFLRSKEENNGSCKEDEEGESDEAQEADEETAQPHPLGNEKDMEERHEFVLSSGRESNYSSTGPRTRELTIDDEFDQYFSNLLL